MKAETVRHYHVFLASPGDMDEQRRAVRRFFDDFNRFQARHWGVEFDVVDWENHSTAGVGRPQELITRTTLERYRESLVLVVGLMGQRFGSPTGEAESGTEEELEWALESHRRTGFPEIKWFFREVRGFSVDSTDPEEIAAALEQWQKVQTFRERFETGDPPVFYRQFEADRFVEVFHQDLSLWLGDPARPWLEGRDDAAEIDRPADLTSYLDALVASTAQINIRGIVGGGRVKSALHHPIEELYTPLVCRDFDVRAGGRTRPLESLLPLSSRLLIEGLPGAGKTTFLRFIACMLGRDILGRDGGTWRVRYLGFDPGRPALVPVFLHLADLVPLLIDASVPSSRRDDRRWLLDLLDNECSANEHPVNRRAWEALLAEGRALLLLDGLDEVADPRLHERVFKIFRDACRHWAKCPMVVTSRTEELREMGFHLAVIEPFGESEIRRFLHHWVAALHDSAADRTLSVQAGRCLCPGSHRRKDLQLGGRGSGRGLRDARRRP